MLRGNSPVTLELAPVTLATMTRIANHGGRWQLAYRVAMNALALPRLARSRRARPRPAMRYPSLPSRRSRRVVRRPGLHGPRPSGPSDSVSIGRIGGDAQTPSWPSGRMHHETGIVLSRAQHGIWARSGGMRSMDEFPVSRSSSVIVTPCYGATSARTRATPRDVPRSECGAERPAPYNRCIAPRGVHAPGSFVPCEPGRCALTRTSPTPDAAPRTRYIGDRRSPAGRPRNRNIGRIPCDADTALVDVRGRGDSRHAPSGLLFCKHVDLGRCA